MNTEQEKSHHKLIDNLKGKLLIVSFAPPKKSEIIEGILQGVYIPSVASQGFWGMRELSITKEETKEKGEDTLDIVFLNEEYITDFRLKDPTWYATNISKKENDFDVRTLKNNRLIIYLISLRKNIVKIHGTLKTITTLGSANAFWFLRDIKTTSKEYNNLDHLFISQKHIIYFKVLKNPYVEAHEAS